MAADLERKGCWNGAESPNWDGSPTQAGYHNLKRFHFPPPVDFGACAELGVPCSSRRAWSSHGWWLEQVLRGLSPELPFPTTHLLGSLLKVLLQLLTHPPTLWGAVGSSDLTACENISFPLGDLPLTLHGNSSWQGPAEGWEFPPWLSIWGQDSVPTISWPVGPANTVVGALNPTWEIHWVLNKPPLCPSFITNLTWGTSQA